QPSEAIRAYMQAVNLDPDDVDGYARVLAFVPEDAALWVRKGDAHRRRNELEEAQTAFDRALRIDSELKEALEGKSSAYLAAGEPQRALRCLDRVIQIDPYDADAWRLRGDVLARRTRTKRRCVRTTKPCGSVTATRSAGRAARSSCTRSAGTSMPSPRTTAPLPSRRKPSRPMSAGSKRSGRSPAGTTSLRRRRRSCRSIRATRARCMRKPTPSRS